MHSVWASKEREDGAHGLTRGDASPGTSALCVRNPARYQLHLARIIRPFSDANLLSSAGDIRQLQTLLSNRGLYDAKIDGSYGPTTRKAIQAFQGNIGDELAGLPTEGLLKELQSLAAQQAPASAKTKRQSSQRLTGGRLQKKIKQSP